MSTQPFITGAVVLGGYGQVATWRRENPDAEYKRSWGPSIIILQSEQSDEGVLSPARDVTISGVDALRALRSAIDEALSAGVAEDYSPAAEWRQDVAQQPAKTVCPDNSCAWVDDVSGPGSTCTKCGCNVPF